MQKNGCGSMYILPQFFVDAAKSCGKNGFMNDAFSKCHPVVNFLFFVGAIGMSVLIQHPAYLLAGVLAAMVYYLLLKGRKGLKTIFALCPLFLLVTAINPLFNTLGATPLFSIFGRNYTLEALLYGGALAGMFVVVMLWFGCYNQVLTSDKFTSLFGNFIPSISLLLVMVFRLVPNFIRKTQQIVGARRSVGKGTLDAAATKDKLSEGAAVLGALTGWALEGSVVTGDSMRARGYGTAKRTSFMIYRMTAGDWVLLLVMAVLLAVTIAAAFLGQLRATFVPNLQLAPVSWGLIAYCGYLLIPSALHIKEAIRWHISRSKI